MMMKPDWIRSGRGGGMVGMCCALAAAVLLTAAPVSYAQFDFLGKSKASSTKKIALFKLKGELAEAPVGMPPLFATEMPLSLKDVIVRMKEARQDPNVMSVILDMQDARPGFAQIQELHQAIKQFAAVDKQVFIHADQLFTATYLLATSATHLCMTPTGDLWLTGLYGESPYLRNMFDKMGVYPDFDHCGDYKSAGEMFTRTGPSPEAAEMMNWLLDDIYRAIIEGIARSRNLTPARVEELINGGPYTAEKARNLGLIDHVQHRQDFIVGIKNRYADAVIDPEYGSDKSMQLPSDPMAFFTFLSKLMNPEPRKHTKPSVGIVYVEGPIMVGSAEFSPFGGSSGAFSNTVRRALDKAAEDSSVKAVVLRVDSPGGSALASEIILDATKRVAAAKPFVVSMGNVAGSGGYYVACGTDTIFADESTITASIGVVSGKLVTTEAWGKIGITWKENKRGDMAGMLSSSAPFSEQERAKMLAYMNEIYDVFKNHVKAARGSKLTKPIDELAGGRVFTGKQALELGLVDKIGSLDDAIRHAAKIADLGEYEIRVIPEPPTLFDLLLGGGKDKGDVSLSLGIPGFADSPIIKALLPLIRDADPQRARAVLRALQQLDVLSREGVVLSMPFDLVIR